MSIYFCKKHRVIEPYYWDVEEQGLFTCDACYKEAKTLPNGLTRLENALKELSLVKIKKKDK